MAVGWILSRGLCAASAILTSDPGFTTHQLGDPEINLSVPPFIYLWNKLISCVYLNNIVLRNLWIYAHKTFKIWVPNVNCYYKSVSICVLPKHLLNFILSYFSYA